MHVAACCVYGCCMTGKQIAEQDQAEARDREFDRKAQKWAIRILIAFSLLAAYAILVVTGWLPPTPWSPMGSQ